MECSPSAFCCEHPVTTFAGLSIAIVAFCMGHAAEIEAAKHPAETFDSWKPKRGWSHKRMSNPTLGTTQIHSIYDWLFLVSSMYYLDSSLQTAGRSQTASYIVS